jgi:DNA-binding GntR family transcriptional regulator
MSKSIKSIGEIGLYLSLKDRVYEYIKSSIITGKIEPNTHLKESGLSESMNVSRAPIREALNKLEKEGLVSIVPRKGAVVTPISTEEVESIWEIRSILEPYAAREAAQKCSENVLNKLENKLKKLLKEPNDFSNYIDSDLEVHGLLFKYLKNKMLKRIIEMVRENSLRILNYAEGEIVFSKDIALMDIKEHIQIIQALKTRDPYRAESLVYVHINNSKQRILRVIEAKS